MTNRNARIRSRVTKNKKLRTETTGRDRGSFSAAASTDKNGTTRVFLDLDGIRRYGEAGWAIDSIELNGREARTLYRLLQKHYGFTKNSK